MNRTWEKAWAKKKKDNPWRVPDAEIVELVGRLRQEGISRILDLGFGLGRHVVFFAREGFDTYGIEPTGSGFQHCRDWLRAEKLDAEIKQGSMSALPFPDGFFDFILSFNVIYHGTQAELQDALREIHRVMKRGGLLYLTLNSTRNEWYGKGEEIECNTFLNPQKGDGDHKHHYSDRREVEELLREWDVEMRRESEEALAGKTYPGSWHWMILARKAWILDISKKILPDTIFQERGC